jgi:hypothetical protein
MNPQHSLASEDKVKVWIENFSYLLFSDLYPLSPIL